MSSETNTGEQTPQGAEGNSAVEITATFADAVATVEGETVATDEETFGQLEEYGGSRFVPSTDNTRSVTKYAAPNGRATIRVMRTGANDSNGGFTRLEEVEAAYRCNLRKYPHHTQVGIKLLNDKILTGYIVIGKSEKGKGRRGLYFPKKIAESVIVLPPIPKRLPCISSALII
jgi:hypothetical protein